ncbi:ankyrin repeat domain-containing protein [Rickettsia rickettsii]|uniref:Uncharacterized protein n=2 Tax=Rickettsia rickettsii TaxID=783 RepID=B0BYB9_RICRO|nr:ankyrin repeat domain-containing protein [Rickettsia rickettsii]AFB21963.1 hypothetical protein RPN_02145 [Rickettsia rickettsii str. Brazil]AFB23818.1 hypothetical protein RPL_04905 [Rickettsia rickettsii str. Colombia]AFB25163.1 hypothetical protein RPO_04910 [Rickettsia rickettsii str. Arizona]AFB27843.1 hypothetical protein RPJ_04860 [Rickettsia rickettsii str. Hino]AFB30503.1 hypothetical protein RPM_04880 [Rickettsia rickettsii str. Hauke]AJG33843.1 ankyin [Rickettsia rickettsii str.
MARITFICSSKHFNVAKLLLKNGAEVDQRKSGGIPLHAVAKNVRCTSKDIKDDEIYKLLVSYGADINAKVECTIEHLSVKVK